MNATREGYSTQAESVQHQVHGPGQLAFTGFDLLWLVAIVGVVLMVSGFTLRVLAKRAPRAPLRAVPPPAPRETPLTKMMSREGWRTEEELRGRVVGDP